MKHIKQFTAFVLALDAVDILFDLSAVVISIYAASFWLLVNSN